MRNQPRTTDMSARSVRFVEVTAKDLQEEVLARLAPIIEL